MRLLAPTLALFLSVSAFDARAALAQEQGPDAAGDDDAKEAKRKAEQQRPHTEFNVVPLVGGDSDIGWGGGALVELARHDPGYVPYKWALEVAGLITFKPSNSAATGRASQRPQIPYQDYYALLTFPHVTSRALRLEIRPSFTQESTQKYYGFGNASQVDRNHATDPYYEYGRIHPTMSVRARFKLAGPFYAQLGELFTWNTLSIPGDGHLADDQRTGSAEVRHLLGSFQDHAVNLLEYSVMYDTRDDEIEARKGMWHQIKLRVSPGGADWMPYRYAQGNVTLRGYVSPLKAKRRLTLAARVVGDWQVGDVPFYELARYEDTFALGGVNGVRGVPAQRYYGKVKALGNVEARSELVDFRLLSKDFTLGVAAFFDGGRLWSEGFNHPELDGPGAGVKYGVGGGLRIHQGSSMVVRLDVAWSPDAAPIGAYFAAGELF